MAVLELRRFWHNPSNEQRRETLAGPTAPTQRARPEIHLKFVQSISPFGKACRRWVRRSPRTERVRFAPGCLLQLSRRGRPGVSTNFMLDLIPSVSQVCLFFFLLLLHPSCLDRSRSFHAFSLSSDFHRHEQALAISLRLLIFESFSYTAVRPSSYSSLQSLLQLSRNIHHHEIFNHRSIVCRSRGVGRSYRRCSPVERRRRGLY